MNIMQDSLHLSKMKVLFSMVLTVIKYMHFKVIIYTIIFFLVSCHSQGNTNELDRVKEVIKYNKYLINQKLTPEDRKESFSLAFTFIKDVRNGGCNLIILPASIDQVIYIISNNSFSKTNRNLLMKIVDCLHKNNIDLEDHYMTLTYPMLDVEDAEAFKLL